MTVHRGATDDPYDLSRFVRAQENDYEQALEEIRGGRKRTHWMWYVFPQVDGLAFSPTSKRYSIKSIVNQQLTRSPRAHAGAKRSGPGSVSARTRGYPGAPHLAYTLDEPLRHRKEPTP